MSAHVDPVEADGGFGEPALRGAVRSPRAEPFYGVGWKSDEGRAMASGLPTIGEADLPGEPRSRRRRRRRRR